MQTYLPLGLDLLKLLILLRLAWILYFDMAGQWHWEFRFASFSGRRWCAQAFPHVQVCLFRWETPLQSSAIFCSPGQNKTFSDSLTGCHQETFASYPSTAAQRQRWYFVCPLMGTASWLRRLQGHVISS